MVTMVHLFSSTWTFFLRDFVILQFSLQSEITENLHIVCTAGNDEEGKRFSSGEQSDTTLMEFPQ